MRLGGSALRGVLRHTPRRSPPARQTRWTSNPRQTRESPAQVPGTEVLRTRYVSKRGLTPGLFRSLPPHPGALARLLRPCFPQPLPCRKYPVIAQGLPSKSPSGASPTGSNAQDVRLRFAATGMSRRADPPRKRGVREPEGRRRGRCTFGPFWCFKRVTPPVGAPLPAGRKNLGMEHFGTRHLKNGARYLG